MPKRRLHCIVRHYLRHHNAAHEAALAELKSLGPANAIRQVASLRHPLTQLCESHQRRVPREAKMEIERRLPKMVFRISRLRTHSDIYEYVQKEFAALFGVGRLAIYDLSLRISAIFGIAPTEIFLHAHPQKSAKLLGYRQGIILYDDFCEQYPAFKDLRPAQIENLLCIYYDALKPGLSDRKFQEVLDKIATKKDICSGKNFEKIMSC